MSWRRSGDFLVEKNIYEKLLTNPDEEVKGTVKELAENETYEDLNKTADVIIRLFKSDTNCNIHIAYGTIVNELKEVSRSYKEARMALDVGKIFFDEIPRNPTGKIEKPKLRERYNAEKLIVEENSR